MADGSSENRTGPKQVHELTFSVPGLEHGDSKKCGGQTFCEDTVNLSLCNEPKTSDSCEKSDSSGVAVNDSTTIVKTNSQKTQEEILGEGEDRKKRCFDRYDSSESSDSGVAVLSPTESSGSSSSDITEPSSPCSPESSCSNAEESTGAGARMPPWASDPAPPPPSPASRRHAAQPAPVRRPQTQSHLSAHRRITEFFNHKMKPQNGLKRDSNASTNEVTKRKCLPKNGVTHDLEKYISYLSQTLSPKVLLDMGKQNEAAAKKSPISDLNSVVNSTKPTDSIKMAPSSTNINGVVDFSRHKESEEKCHTTTNGFVDIAEQDTESLMKNKLLNGHLNGLIDRKRKSIDSKITAATDPSANCIIKHRLTGATKRKVSSTPMSNDLTSVRIAPATSASQSPKKATTCKTDTRTNGIVSSTTKLDSRMDGVTCGSNNLSLNSKTSTKKESSRKTSQPTKRNNRKSSACIANSKNISWSKANNLKQLQQQNCINSTQNLSINNLPREGNVTPKMNIPNGVQQMPMTVNGSLGNLNVPVANLQNCHQINIPQPCNGTVAPNNLTSFVTVPPNLMLTTLRIPQNGIPAQTLTQQNNMTAFNRPNVNVPSPSKLNNQFVFPFMQNINGAVVQIPNLMPKMQNFVLPQTTQLTTRQDPLQSQLQNQQAAQILINGTLLKLSNSITSTYPNVNKPAPVTSQPISVMNKNVPGIQSVGMTVQPKSNYTVNFSHTMLMPQPGYIVTSVPNINAKETWSCLNTNLPSSSQTSCSNTIVHQSPSLMTNFVSHALHTSSIPIAPVKPPDNPIQGTDPPSSTVNDIYEFSEDSKSDIPWLTKTVNNNIVSLDCSKISSRPFAQLGLPDKFGIDDIKDIDDIKKSLSDDEEDSIAANKSLEAEIRKVEEVAKREETIFSQITILKDICSNVQNSVIEENFKTESSESGIGTDKSIGSPSDSQTIKECDDDSSLSLSISVSSVETQSSQKSPILKQPKTLRFPRQVPIKIESNSSSSSDTTPSVSIVCLWEKCKLEFKRDTDLLEHIQIMHVEPQDGQEHFVCLWEQCKVRGKQSCSRLWLQRHTQSHGGNKPFKCIVDGCDRRFSTQTLLERHVNNHFTETSPNAGGSKKTTDSASKLIRRNGKKLRYRRQPWSARMFDFFDAGTMEGLAWRLARCSRWRVGGPPLPEPPGRHTVTLRAHCLATRYNAAARQREALLTYHPPHVVEDEWVPAKEVSKIKRVEIASLPPQSKVALYDAFCSSYEPGVRERQANVDPPSPSPPPSGAKKRKMGRRHGGECFWPSGR